MRCVDRGSRPREEVLKSGLTLRMILSEKSPTFDLTHDLVRKVCNFSGSCFDLTHDLVRKVCNFSGSCFDLTHDLVRKVCNFSGSCFISPTTAEDRAARSLRRFAGGGALRA